MKNKPVVLTLFLLFFYSFLFAQRGEVSGVLSDETGETLIGASIRVKGTTNGTVTDIDGSYNISCSVGDVLVFSYTGYGISEVKVTASMFEDTSTKVVKVPTDPVRIKTSDAYTKALETLPNYNLKIPSLKHAKKTFKRNGLYYSFNNIENIVVGKQKVELTTFKPNMYYEVGLNTSFGVQFIQAGNLPKLQNSFSQGVPVSGALTFQGPDTDNLFSYGPSLKTLEFDGSRYLYDLNGQLVTQGNGNGIDANTYANTLLETSIKSSNNFHFNISKEDAFLGFTLSNQIARDLFNQAQRSNNQIGLSYQNNRNEDVRWKTHIDFKKVKDNQPNINGFQNNLLLNLWATPPTFSNQQGTQLENDEQRRFSSKFNHPDWLLDQNRNTVTGNHFTAGVQNDLSITDAIRMSNKLSYNYSEQGQGFGLLSGTAGFDEGFLSNKKIINQSVNAVLNFNYEPELNNYNDLKIQSVLNYRHDDLGFNLMESAGFAPFSFNDAQNSRTSGQNKSRNVLRLLHHIKYELDEAWIFQLTNNSYYSSIQENQWFLPSASFNLDLKELLDMQIYRFSIFSNASLDVNDTPLYYSNLSHNSLLLSPEESLRYTTNNDLFIEASLDLEQKENYEFGTNFGVRFGAFSAILEATYFNSKTKGSIFPILNQGVFELHNVADIRNSGFELSLNTGVGVGRAFSHFATLTFSKYQTQVESLLNNEESIPIAGFSNVSKNLVVGEPAGVLIGSAYARDGQGNRIIGADGFPLVDPIPQIIGDPIPDFNLGFTNEFRWKKLELLISLDIQKGGEIWNGTQNVLNYLGRSQQSADERGIQNFVFTGVDQAGNPNMRPVDFYDPNLPISANRFVRYGFAGVAEEAIVDASYINLRSINFSYSFSNRYNNHDILRECRLGIYAKNMFTWSRFRGNNPYSSLYGTSAGQELHFFNRPLVSELGFTAQLII